MLEFFVQSIVGVVLLAIFVKLVRTFFFPESK